MGALEKLSTAASVCGPKTPSAVMPSRRCSSLTAGPLEPTLRLAPVVPGTVVEACAPATPAEAGPPIAAAVSASDTFARPRVTILGSRRTLRRRLERSSEASQ